MCGIAGFVDFGRCVDDPSSTLSAMARALAHRGPDDERVSFDAATRVWRGSERFGIQRLLAEKAWPTTGKKSLGAQEVLLDPAEPGASKCRGIDANQRLESGIGRFGDKNGADAGCDVFRA